MSLYSPDGWSVGRGTWGVDVLQDTTTFLTGSSAVKLTNSIIGDVKYLVSISYPCRPSDVFRGEAITRGTTLSGIITGNITVALYWYDPSGTFISSSSIWNGTHASNIWFTSSAVLVAPSNAASYKILCIKDDTNFSCWFDNVEIHPAAASFLAINASATTVVATSWTKVGDLKSDRIGCWDFGNNWDNTGSPTPHSQMNALAPQRWGELWYITGHVTVQSVPNGKFIQARIYDVSGSRAIYGEENVNGSGGTIGLTAMVHGIVDAANWLAPALGIYTSNGSNLTTYTGINDVYISGHRIL